MWSDDEVVRYIGGHALSREDTWRRSLAACGQWPYSGWGYWIAEMKADGSLAGQLGFADFKRDMQPSIEGLPEAGWIFSPHAHGKGYAREAVAAALAWADERLDAPMIPAIIDPGNAPSIRVAERCGFAEREEATYRGAPILLFRRMR